MQQDKSLIDFQPQWVQLVEKAFDDYQLLTPDERLWYNTQVLISDVDNGGLISHYYNAGADHIENTIEDLQRLGFSNVADLVIKVNNIFPDGKPSTDMEERNEVIEQWEEGQYDQMFEDLDNLFYEFQDDLEDKLVQFILSKGLAE